MSKKTYLSRCVMYYHLYIVPLINNPFAYYNYFTERFCEYHSSRTNLFINLNKRVFPTGLKS